METQVTTVRYMVAETGSKMAVNSYSMRIFDTLQDAMASIPVERRNDYAYRVYALSPIHAPKKIGIAKYFEDDDA